jgi:ribose 5-phosphate isomerase B
MIYIGCDHAGFNLKQCVIEFIQTHIVEYNIKDLGCFDETSCDYPMFAKLVVKSILKEQQALGILICGTGVGMSIAANRFNGIRAALCHDIFTAQMAKEHNNANILVLGARVINKDTALNITKIFLNTKFSNIEKHIKRNKMLDLLV